MFFLTVAYLLAAGVFLIWVPWTGAWDSNFFVLAGGTVIESILTSPWSRAAVAGFGLAHIAVGVVEIRKHLRRGERAEP